MNRKGLFVVVLSISLSLVAGIAIGRAQQQSVGWGPAVIHVSQMTAADFPAKAPNATVATKMVAVADGSTVQMQTGHTAKHYHANANEMQYIVSGSGMFWLGDKQIPVGPGDLIIIPKGTAHGMASDYTAIAIKSPPQDPSDAHPVP